MSKHTPGPWNIAPKKAPYIATSDDPKIKAQLVSTGADRFEALSVGTNAGSVAIIPLDESNEANARLIAAAPDLLEALQKAIEEMQGLPHSLGYEFTHLPAMRAAISKATQPVTKE